MRPADLHEGSLDLAVAHPSGIAMLLAGRPTRLSHLFREPGVLDAAQRQARAIRAAAAALADEHGLRACVLAVGLASWREERTREVVSTPVLLRPVQLRPRSAGHSGGVDYEVDLGGPVRTNPALVRELARRAIPFDAQSLAALSVHAHGFDPTPSLERLRSLISVCAPDITVRSGLLVTALVDVAPALVAALDDAADRFADCDVVASLAGDAHARRRLFTDPGTGVEAGLDGGLPRPTGAVARARTEQVEALRVLPLDHHQHAVLEDVMAGRSLRVEAGPGTGATQLAAATVAALAGAGRRVLLVAGQQVEVADIARALAGAGLADLVVDPTAPPERPTDRPVTGKFLAVPVSSAVPEGGAAPPDADPSADAAGSAEGAGSLDGASRRRGAAAPAGARGQGADELVDPAARLLTHHRALHAAREPWGVSALDALHALAALPGGAATTRTAVRLPSEALASLGPQARGEAAAALRQAVELDAVTVRSGQTPWTGAALGSRQEAIEALAAVRALVEDLLPSLRRQSRALAAGAGLSEPASVADCAAQLSLLAAARDTLDLFLPTVFERSLAPLVEATQPMSDRAVDGVRTGFWERRRLERDARDLVRPGILLPDLHAALRDAEQTRRSWQSWTEPDRADTLPRVPQGVPAAEVVLDGVHAQLEGLEDVLAPTSGGGDLLRTPWSELDRRLVALAADAGALEDLPRRTALLTALEGRGLAELAGDLRARAVPADGVAVELEHAWWRSVLDSITETEPGLVLDAGRRAQLVSDLEAGERRRVASAAQRVREAVTAATAGGVAPCRVSSPLALPHEMEPGEHVDVVVLVAAHRIGIPEAVLAAEAGHQVLMIGDPGGLPPARVAPRAGGAPMPARASAFEAFTGVMPTARLQWQHRMPAQLAAIAAVVPGAATGSYAVPCAPGRRPVRLRVAPEVTGRPDEDGVVESPDGEVAAVVEVVAAHARSHPEESLAVIALSRPHARRVADALRAAMPGRPELADYLTRRGREPFVVTDLERCEDTVRDAVVLTVGFGLTPLGRFVHRFGPLDAPGGHRGLAVALTRGRRRLTAVTCVAGADLDDARLRSMGARALRDVLVVVEAASVLDARGGLAAVGIATPEDAPTGPSTGPVTGPVPGGAVPAAGAAPSGDGSVLTPGGVGVLEARRTTSTSQSSLEVVSDADPLLERLAAGLRERGLRCAAGPAVPDLVVLPAHRDSPAIAVVTDLAGDPAGAGEAPTPADVLARELSLPRELERLGWLSVRLGAVELFRDPTGVVRQVALAAGVR